MVYPKYMVEGIIPNLQFQTYYVSKEESNCPFISDIIGIGKNFDNLTLFDNIGLTTISIRYAKRILINSRGSNITKLQKEDFLEIVDYNPIKNIILAIGPKEPKVETPLHWLIHHAKNEVNAIIQIKNAKLIKEFENKFPTTDKEYQSGGINQAKSVLEILRESNIAIIKNQGLIFVGNSSNEVEKLVLKTFEEIK
jgi:hypothetical protein